MRIAIDISPISDKTSGHKVRGVGVYIQNLQNSLVTYFPNNEYFFFDNASQIPSNIDIVHYPYFEPFFLSLPFLNKYKTVVTIHDLTPIVFPQYFPAGIKGNVRWQIQKKLLQFTKAVIVDSEASKKDVVKYTGMSSEKIKVVYLSASPDYKKVSLTKEVISKIQKKYSLPDKFALYVGDVTWNKNLPRLIEATLINKIPLVMVGKALALEAYDSKNPWNKDLTIVKEIASNNLDMIKILGFIPSKDLITIYNMATVLVMPSLYEGFGLPVLEAMSCGTPVVTSREGSLPEVAGDAAYYVDAYDSKDIGNGIKKMYTDTNINHEFSLKGEKRAEKFSWENTAKQMMTIYKDIVEK